jgi:4-amino-4-deoxy-L-arabinose transferase-like glycosyltransferase
VTHPAASLQPALSRNINPTPAVKSLVLLLAALFIAAGLVFIPYVGIQTDEALFSEPLYSHIPQRYAIHPFHAEIPLMVMTYVGALKTWLYAAIFALWTPGLWSLRVPPLLAGAAAIWLFYRVLDRAAGARAALAGAALLATDAMFVLTTTFDWGPVALQHLLLTGGMLLVLAGYQDQSRAKFGWGFFLFGLALWDKALFVWILSGVVVACAAVFPRELRRMLTRRNVAVAAGAFLLGASPLILFNVRAPLATFRGNAVWSAEDLAGKARMVKLTMEGSCLFGYLVHDEWAPLVQNPQLPVERASVAVQRLAGERRSGLMFWAFLASVLLVPFVPGKRRAVLFALVAMAVAWPQMAFTKNTGGAAHHVVLLWPLPHMAIAVSFAAASARLRRFSVPALATAIIVISTSNLLVLNQHLAQLIRYGAAGVWSDAIFPLSERLAASPGRNIFLSDWGELDNLILLNQGRLRIWIGSDPLVGPQISPGDLRQIGRMLSTPSSVFVCHTKPYEVFPGVTERLIEGAQRLGYSRRVLDTVADSNGRPVYEIVDFVRTQ